MERRGLRARLCLFLSRGIPISRASSRSPLPLVFRRAFFRRRRYRSPILFPCQFRRRSLSHGIPQQPSMKLRRPLSLWAYRTAEEASCKARLRVKKSSCPAVRARPSASPRLSECPQEMNLSVPSRRCLSSRSAPLLRPSRRGVFSQAQFCQA